MSIIALCVTVHFANYLPHLCTALVPAADLLYNPATLPVHWQVRYHNKCWPSNIYAL